VKGEVVPTININSFDIDRKTTATGSTCTVNYSYTLTCTETEKATNATFTMSSELWGEDPFFDPDDKLGSPPFDTHLVDCTTPMPVTKSFPVNCKILNEDRFSNDEIYMKLTATPTGGTTGTPVTVQSQTISAAF
jgi:hypothetical protein